ncbi:CGNR zinc finger domain-containing protein [Streptomyces sp. NBC_00059]|uniref:CGNR zinc finger domain-containing protein n=1 Tax=Streptomyces sp. NBC_00059 TaxID=2975635 RepID=UPI00224EB448|nr:CGNR zinc finger domain-containing protein [Streptomyces sp. NBC_00059]MCX5412205.1 ABATE domain-containing protein [Streptomyces sp. NBC_00059]
MAAGTGAYGRRFDSGRICLDLVATGAGGCEQLDRPARLAEWLVASRLVPRGTPLAAVDETWPARFWQLRTGIDRLMTAQLVGGSADSALDRINALAAGPTPGLRAVRDQGGVLVRALSADPGCGALLAVVARDAVDLLTDPVARAGLRRCEGDHCGRLYLDTSRGRRRRWCSSEVCGNRERVARHRRRARAMS